ncbi:MAG: hypothetical protein A2W93_04735 [Bacteroidetes bacterium GWF2_43_63]|nr:MAG: hypothetical protein A2W94_12725 [Bacteroidetes bacterium GWE2_42_42]OFY56062.1 MAG: hypothetical protein A2W93_04735 [Bacteroidetes bacterium GWF2_43_63]
MAEVEKQTLIGRSLQEQGCEVTFVCKKSFNYDSDLPYKGTVHDINYIYTSFLSRRHKNKIVNRILWSIGGIVEKLYLLFARYDCAIVNSRNYMEVKCYSFIIHLRKKKIFLTHVEDYRSMHPEADGKLLKRIDAFESLTWSKIDGVFPISEELRRQVISKNPSLPVFNIPVLVNPEDAMNAIDVDPINEDYFMFCGSSDYEKTIIQIIRGFEGTKGNIKLLLVLNGGKRSMENAVHLIKSSRFSDRVVLKSALPKTQLWGYYTRATALLIPLNFDQRDKARFPHKIGEYCASKGVIITSRWGEIPNFFTNKQNAVLLNSDDPLELSEAMKFVADNKEISNKMRLQAFELASGPFNFANHGASILNFMKGS